MKRLIAVCILVCIAVIGIALLASKGAGSDDGECVTASGRVFLHPEILTDAKREALCQ